MNERGVVNFNLCGLPFIIEVWFEWDGSASPAGGDNRTHRRPGRDTLPRPLARVCVKREIGNVQPV